MAGAVKDKAPKDLFLNFAGVASRSHPSAGDSLQETVFNTGLSIRGALIWLIHLVEFNHMDLTANNHGTQMALSTRQGLTVMPELNDDGVIALSEDRLIGTFAAGASRFESPSVQKFLPPIPIAAPALSVYVIARSNHADSIDELCPLRLGFTTAPLDSKTYMEIAEAWGW